MLLEDEDHPGILVEYAAEASNLRVKVGPASGQVEVVVFGWPAHRVVCADEEIVMQPVEGGWRVQLDGCVGLELVACGEKSPG
jgi:hypothetical protein